MRDETPKEWLEHLAEWIDSYWQDGMRPDEWTLKEWAQRSRDAAKKLSTEGK